jgi:hypothetical protein
MPAAAVPIERLFSETLEIALLEHAGRWTVIAGDEIVGVGDTPIKALQAAARAGMENGGLLHFVPEEGKAYFF